MASPASPLNSVMNTPPHTDTTNYWVLGVGVCIYKPALWRLRPEDPISKKIHTGYSLFLCDNCSMHLLVLCPPSAHSYPWIKVSTVAHWVLPLVCIETSTLSGWGLPPLCVEASTVPFHAVSLSVPVTLNNHSPTCSNIRDRNNSQVLTAHCSKRHHRT